MTWQPVDCHAHSQFSDGALTVGQVVERAAALGVHPSVADHISRQVKRGIHSAEGTARYLDALDAFDVLRAGEFCYHDSLWRELPPHLVRRFTHRIGSLHAIRLSDGRWLNAFVRTLPTGLTVGTYMDAHLATLREFARDMPVDILGHPTLVAYPFRGLDPDVLWTEQHEDLMVEAMFEAGLAFEISARYQPHERLVRKAVARGVRMSLGSDGHTFEQVANIARPLALARALGVAEQDLYDPRQHGSRTGAWMERNA